MSERHLPLPFWGVLVLPFGLCIGFAQVAAPYVLRDRGVSMALIATVSNVAQLPHVFKLLWSPTLDSGPPRRFWYLGSIAVTAAALAVTALIPPSPSESFLSIPFLWWFTGALTLAQAAVATSTAAVLALMATTVPDCLRGRVSGWQTAGNLVGTAAGGGLIAWLLRHTSANTTAMILAVVCLACALPAAFIDETARPRANLLRLFKRLTLEIWKTLRSRSGWTGMVLCLSPVGTGALTGLFSALARDYATTDAETEHLVLVVTGVFGGLVNAVGALIGGYVADRMNRRLTYVLFGGVTGLSAVGMVFLPATPWAFTLGCLAYTFATGLCYSAFYAFVLELIGQRDGVTTQIALYVGASNLAISYVTWLDGATYDWAKTIAPGSTWAPRAGMLGMDALLTFVGICILALMMAYLRRSPGKGRSASAAA